MRQIFNRIVLLAVVCALAATASFAQTKSKTVTFPEDVMVAGKLFKKGTYKMKFNQQTGELTIADGNNSATVSARLQKRDAKATRTVISSRQDGDNRVLSGITFRGEDETYQLTEGTSDTGAASTSPQH
ncbi:MAG: hypothetical protein AUG51_12330 [Acidobacteria bacterium 13_1_20CM_3_53_8]|nr:MAG: hypothetical protein AUG51_12330 [Acidobacteria bacterium 13_1_20CM_3_53_8]